MISIIDYGMGNLGSIQNMFKKIGVPSVITSDKEMILNSEKLLLPGVGSFDRAISNLQDLDLIEVIQKKANDECPMLGICLGMQLLANKSEEGTLPGLGLIPGEVKYFNLPSVFKVPHIGWNLVKYQSSPLFLNFDTFDETKFYFVHSYYFECLNPSHTIGVTDFGGDFTSVIQKGNIYGAQFHPEKSHKFGMLMLKNFSEI
jgi:glutamine amidotransferase